jgi:hypothetical protein
MSIAPFLPGVIGVALILAILWDAFETILVPRRIGRRVRLTRYFYLITWRIWRALAVGVRKPSRREALLGFFGPLSLILLLFCWAAGLILGFALLGLTSNAAAGSAGSAQQNFGLQLYMSGETFFTLGFGDFTPTTTVGRVLAVLEAGLGFGFLGTVVGYLPTMYSAFAQREIEISLMDARAGSPPTAVEFLRRTSPAGDGHMCDGLLSAWERWAAQLLETHISYPQLAYYRSQHSNQSWLGTLITILDTTSLILAQSSHPSARQAQLTFAMARHALVDITQNFVSRFGPGGSERLSGEDVRSIRAQLLDGTSETPAEDDFESRLAELRVLYEPYAQALGKYLLFELPPWVRTRPRHDNWRGGPWDKLIPSRRESTPGDDEHF